MASYQLQLGPAPKATINAQLASATLSQCTFMDPGLVPNATEPVAASHFAAAVASAQAAVAALAGPADRVQVLIQGYRSNVTAGKPGDRASSIKVVALETW